MYGYMGKILKINLTTRSFKTIELDQKLVENYLGGSGLASYFLYQYIDRSTDPFDEKNCLLFFTGPLTATKFPTAVRYEVCTRSPLTKAWLGSSSSGNWARCLKRTGYDGIIIQGISRSPVFLLIDEDEFSLHDARNLWGKDTFDTQNILKKIIRKDCSVACIGPSGENLIPISCIVNDEGRAAGRGGAGAVMGSKRLKAIVVKGAKIVSVSDPRRFSEVVKKVHRHLRESPPMQQRKQFGTAGSIDTNWKIGSIPVKNWTVAQWPEGCAKIGGERISETILKSHVACFGCPIRCSRWIKIEKGRYKMEGPGPEYETIGAFGTMCLNDNLEAICWANDLCNRYGIDTISTGAGIAFAMEAYEKGLISKHDTDGIDLTWGNAEGIVRLTESICRADGFGKLLGKGTKKAAEEIGGESEDFVTHVKGMEVPMHDPRAFFSMAGSYATSPRGGCHLHGGSMLFESAFTLPDVGITKTLDRHSNKDKGKLIMVAQDLASLVDSSVFCFFPAIGLLPHTLKIISEAINAVCGTSFSPGELIFIGERITNLQRILNKKLGFTRKDDQLPKRLLESFTNGPNAGRVPNLEIILDDYYKVRGWDKNGIPTRRKLNELGLDKLSFKE